VEADLQVRLHRGISIQVGCFQPQLCSLSHLSQCLWLVFPVHCQCLSTL